MRTKQQFVQQFVAPCLEPLGTLNGSWGALGEPSLKNAIKTVVFHIFYFSQQPPKHKGEQWKTSGAPEENKKGEPWKTLRAPE